MTKIRKTYYPPMLSAMAFNPAFLMAGSFVEGGKPGEKGDADTNRKHPISFENWNYDGNYWK